MGKGKGGNQKPAAAPVQQSTEPKAKVGTKRSRWKGAPGYATQRALNQLNAWKKGKRVMLTIPNPSGDTSQRFIKVEARDVWGDPNKKPMMNRDGMEGDA